MTRSITAAMGLFAVLGLAPEPALAASMCAELPTHVDAGTADDPLLGGLSGISMIELVVAQPREGRSGGNDAVLWCTSSDDPRCSPVRHNSDPTPTLASLLLRAAGPADEEVPAPSAVDMWFPEVDSRAPVGTRRRLERPPRP